MGRIAAWISPVRRCGTPAPGAASWAGKRACTGCVVQGSLCACSEFAGTCEPAQAERRAYAVPLAVPWLDQGREGVHSAPHARCRGAHVVLVVVL